MTQFYNGMEETNWTGWTLSGVVALGPRLLLTCGVDDCSSLSTWTNTAGTNPTVESNRFKWTQTSGTNQIQHNTITPSGDFDARIDADTVTFPTGTTRTNRLFGVFGANNVSVAQTLTTIAMLSTGSVTVGSVSTTPQPVTLRLTRVGNVFTAYYFDYYSTYAWVQVASSTLAYAATGTFILATDTISGSPKTYTDNFRSVYPSVTTGTATSPVMDTVDGVTGIGWFNDYGGTGTVAVTYRTGASSAACSAASYVSATNWAAIAADPNNRYVQVLITFTGGSTSAASPEFGPLLINSSISAANLQLLWKRAVCAAVRHTDTSNRMAVMEPASASNPFTAFWSRYGLGIGQWCAAGNGPSLTFEGTTFNIAQQFVDGFNQTVTDMTGNETLNVEGANYALPGIFRGRSLIVPLITNARKKTWCSNLDTQSAASTLNNHLAFAMNNYAFMNALNIYDVGRWKAYTDTAIDTPYNTLITYSTGAGAWNDNSNHWDTYMSVVTEQLAMFHGVRPTYHNDSTIVPLIKANRRNKALITDPDGESVFNGRSIHSAEREDAPRALTQVAQQITGSGGWAAAREAIGRAVWQTFRRSYIFGYDFMFSPPYRIGNSLTTESYVSRSQLLGNWSTFLGNPGWDANFPSGAGTFTEANASAWAWPNAGIAFCYDGTLDGSAIQLENLSWDLTLGSTSYYASKYMVRATASRFGANVGNDANSQVSPAGNGVEFSSSALSSGNICFLGDASSTGTYHLGATVAAWRTGTARETSATKALTTTSVTVTEIFYAARHHYVVLSKIAGGAATLSSAKVVSPVIPLVSGGALLNTQTNTSGAVWAYGEGPVTGVDPAILAVFIRGVSSNLDTPTASTDYLSSSLQINRFNFGGRSVGVSCSGTQTGNSYYAADVGIAHAAMTAATEATWLTNYSLTGDVVTFTADSNGTPEVVYLAFVSQNLSAQTVGSYAVTGTAVTCFSGKSASADWCGGAGVTLISFNSANLLGLASAGNVSMQVISPTQVTVWWDGLENLTVYLAAWPASGLAYVFATAWDGTLVDVTASCTITAGVSVLIPSSLATTYGFGLVTLQLVTGWSVAWL